MKTTIDIPEDVLADSMKFSGAKTKRDAVVQAMETFNRRKKAEAFIKEIADGPPLDFPSNDEIEAADVAEAERSLRDYQSRAES